MLDSRLEYLFERYLQNMCDTAEEQELMAFLAKNSNEGRVQKLLEPVIENTGVEIKMPNDTAASLLQNILRTEADLVIPFTKKKQLLTVFLRVAAVIIFIAGSASVYWMLATDKNLQKTALLQQNNDLPILSYSGSPTLKSSNGTTIVLDSIKNGTVLQNAFSTISKQNGLLVYKALTTQNTGAPIVYNILSTPRGGQYQVVLPDGSKVWLNASSSIRFPSAFTGNERVVQLTGEGYFEVARNKQKPFYVEVNEMQVQVLGTHFNINGYIEDGLIKTSLLEGSIKIKNRGATGWLKPGQQAVINNQEDKITVGDANLDEVMAWKNGLFQFEGADIVSIMKEIARWYDVAVTYPDKLPVRQFNGKISRNAKLSEVLKILELSNVKFTVTGKTIIVQ